MPAGRPKLHPPVEKTAAFNEGQFQLDQEKIISATVLFQQQAVEQRQQEDVQLAQAAQAVGGALMARLHKTFSHAAEVSMFLQVRELPLAVLRRIPIPEIAATAANFGASPQEGQEKTAATAANLDDFCRRVFGRSATVLREEAQNFQTLGEQAYEVAARLHLNRSALRVARTLPPEKLEVVRSAIESGSTKADVLSVIEDLAEKVQQAEAATAEAKAELDASNRRVEVQAKRIHEFADERDRFDALSDDDKLVELQRAVTVQMRTASAVIIGRLRQALLALHAQDGKGQELFMAGVLGQLKVDIAVLREELQLPDLSKASDLILAAEMGEWCKP